jgi:hypothetical protein
MLERMGTMFRDDVRLPNVRIEPCSIGELRMLGRLNDQAVQSDRVATRIIARRLCCIAERASHCTYAISSPKYDEVVGR